MTLTTLTLIAMLLVVVLVTLLWPLANEPSDDEIDEWVTTALLSGTPYVIQRLPQIHLERAHPQPGLLQYALFRYPEEMTCAVYRLSGRAAARSLAP
jgi:hypothetical protein